MDDGTRTHDDWNHNPGLYQLSYTHHCSDNILHGAAASCLAALPTGGQPHTLPGFRYAASRQQCTTFFLVPRHSSLLYMARPAGFEPATLGLAYQLRLSTPHYIMSLWSGLSLHHHRCRTYSLYGSPYAARGAGFLGIAISLDALPAAKVSPIQCNPLYRFCFPVKAPTCTLWCTLKGRCSIQLSYGR